MPVAALPLHRNRVRSSYTRYGSLARMTFDVEPETPGKTQCTVLYNLYFLNVSEDASSELLMGFGNLDLHLFFPPPSFNGKSYLNRNFRCCYRKSCS